MQSGHSLQTSVSEMRFIPILTKNYASVLDVVNFGSEPSNEEYTSPMARRIPGLRSQFS